MKEHPWTTTVCALLAVLLSTMGLLAQSKIGYVDSEKIRSGFEPVRDAQKQLDEENNKWEQALGEKTKALSQMEKDLETYSLLLSDAKKKERQDEIDAQRVDIQTFQKRIWGEGGSYFKKQEELMRPVFDQIKVAIDEVADDKGLDIVFDSIEGNIVFAKEGLDITDEVVELLKRSTQTSKTNRSR